MTHELSLSHRLCLGLSLVASIASGVANAEVIPFKANIAIAESVHPPAIVCPGLQGDISGKGASAQLGKLTATSTDCIIPANPGLTEFIALSTNGVLTTTEGSLNFSYMVTLELTSAVGKIAGGFWVVGGTGRFAGYCGGGNITGVEAVKLDPATGTGTGQGHITLVGIIQNQSC